jgi:RNA polymerase sigma-70 factor (ECF subfamily)
VRDALADKGVREELGRHAVARLAALLADRQAADRDEWAREAVQETSRRALAGEVGFDSSQASAAAWLHGILENVLLEYCRTLRKQPAQPSSDPARWDELEARLAAPDHAQTLRRLLDSLPDAQRQIVTMHHLDGMSHEDISAELGISVGCSRVRLARAMIELKRLAAGGNVP